MVWPALVASRPLVPDLVNADANVKSPRGFDREPAQAPPLSTNVLTPSLCSMTANWTITGNASRYTTVPEHTYTPKSLADGSEQTCSSDKTVKIFEIDRESHRLVDTLRGCAAVSPTPHGMAS